MHYRKMKGYAMTQPLYDDLLAFVRYLAKYDTWEETVTKEIKLDRPDISADDLADEIHAAQADLDYLIDCDESFQQIVRNARKLIGAT